MYHIEVQDPQCRWKRTEQEFTLLMVATKALCDLVDCGVSARLVDECGTVWAEEGAYNPDMCDNVSAEVTVYESGVYRCA